MSEHLPSPTMPVMRSMTAGQVCAFACNGTQPNEQTSVTSIARKIGGEFHSKTVLIVDPLGPEATRLLLVTCAKPAAPKQRRGPKRKNPSDE